MVIAYSLLPPYLPNSRQFLLSQPKSKDLTGLRENLPPPLPPPNTTIKTSDNYSTDKLSDLGEVPKAVGV